MVQDKFHNIVIALAGMTQAICLIEDLAKTGKTNVEMFKVSMNSLFQIEPHDAMSVFGDVNHLKLGLKKLIHILDTKSPRSFLALKPILSLIRLEKKIARSPQAMNILKERFMQAKKQVDYFDLMHPIVIANLADIYTTIGHPFRFRFYVSGNQNVFKVKENMEKIRALLLAAIRASVLWRQMGGTRLQFIFAHKKIKSMAQLLLNNLD